MVYLGLLLAVVLDVSVRLLLPDRFALQTAPPDLPLLTALYIGFHARNASQLGYAVSLGLIADCFSSHPLGHFAFLYGASAYVARRVSRYLPPDAALSYVVASFLVGVVAALLALLLAVVTTRGAVAPGLGRALLQALTSALFAPIVFSGWDRSRFFRGAIGGERYEFA